jgi:hypothetical protein
MSLDDVFNHFRTWDRSCYNAFACQGSEPTEKDLVEFEGVVGFRLPPEFREFTMSPLGGLYLEVKEELWPRAKEFEVGPFWSFLYGLSVFGISAEIPEWLDLRVQFQEFREAGYPSLVPFLRRVGDANRYCFTSSGAIVEWDHEVPEEPSAVELSFSELLMRELRGLAERKDRKVSICAEAGV